MRLLSIFLALFLLFLVSSEIVAQVYVEPNGEVRVGTLNDEPTLDSLLGVKNGIIKSISVDAIGGNGGGTDDQVLSLNGSVLSIESGNSVDLSGVGGGGGTDDQTLAIDGTIITIENGNTIDLSDAINANGVIRYLTTSYVGMTSGPNGNGTSGGTASGSQYNTFIGDVAGYSMATGIDNIFVGRYAGQRTTTGSRNVYLGGYTGQFDTLGSYNNFIGYAAGEFNSGTAVNSFGYAAGQRNKGSHNNFSGYYSAHENKGQHNNFLGYYSGEQNEGHYNNIFGITAGRFNKASFVNAFGYATGRENTGAYVNLFGRVAGFENSGSHVNAMGYYAGYYNTKNHLNAIGYAAGKHNTGELSNFIGYQSGENNTASYVNALGRAAGQSNTGHSVNLFGYYSGRNNTGIQSNLIGGWAGSDNSGSYSNIIGYQTGQNNSGDHVNLFGYLAGQINTVSFVNAMGYTAGRNNTGERSNLFGVRAGRDNTGTYANIFGGDAGVKNTGHHVNLLGYAAGYTNGGNHVNFFGYQAGYNSKGHNNNFFGYRSGFNNDSGADNVFIGHSSGVSNTTGSRNIAIGRITNLSSPTGSDQINIGNAIYKLSDNRIGLFTATPQYSFHVIGDGHFTGAFIDSGGNSGTNGDVLTSTGATSSWVPFGSLCDGCSGGGNGSSHTGTTGSVFFADTDGAPTEDNNNLFWDNSKNWLGVGINSFNSEENYNGKLRVNMGFEEFDKNNVAYFSSAYGQSSSYVGSHRVILNELNHGQNLNINTNIGVHNIIIGNSSAHNVGVDNYITVYGSAQETLTSSGLVNSFLSNPDVSNGYIFNANALGVGNNFSFANFHGDRIEGFRNFAIFNGQDLADSLKFYGLVNDIELKANQSGGIYGVYNNFIANSGSTNSANIFGNYTYIENDDTNGAHYGLYIDVPDSVSTLNYAAVFKGNVSISEGSLFQSSDEKLKEEILPFDEGLALLNKLDVKSYYLKDDKSTAFGTEKRTRHFGLIAQDLTKIVPDLVREVEILSHPKIMDKSVEYENGSVKSTDVNRSFVHTSEKFLGVNYLELVPVLIQAVKEQQKQIKALEDRIKKLENK